MYVFDFGRLELQKDFRVYQIFSFKEDIMNPILLIRNALKNIVHKPSFVGAKTVKGPPVST